MPFSVCSGRGSCVRLDPPGAYRSSAVCWAGAVLDATAALDAALFRGDARPRSGRSFSLLFSRSSRGLRHRLGAPGLFCSSAADASLDVSFMCITLVASAEASAAHSVQDVRGMAIVGRRHVKSSSSGRAVATEESEGALRGHVSFPREVGSSECGAVEALTACAGVFLPSRSS